MSELRSTAKHVLVYSFANVAGRIVGFVMLPLYSHALRGTGYGVIGVISAGLNFLVSLMGYGFGDAIIRHYHDETLPNRKASITTATILVVMFNLITLTPAIIFARPLSGLLIGDPGMSRYLILAIATYFFETVGSTASSLLLVKRRSLLYAMIGLLRLVVGLGLNIYLIVVLKWGLNGYFVSGLAVSVMSFAVYMVMVLRDNGLVFDREVAREMIRFQAPLIPGYLFTFVSRQVERLMVRFQINLEAVGVLEFGYKIPELIAVVVTGPFMNAWHTKRTEIAEQPGAPREFGRMLSFFFFLVCYVGTAIAITATDLIGIMAPSEFVISARIAQIEVVTMIATGLRQHLYFGLFWKKKTALLTRINIGHAIVKIGVSYLFIHAYGLFGASFSSMIVNVLGLVLVAAFSQRLYRIEIQRLRMLFIGGMSLCIYLVSITKLVDAGALGQVSRVLANGMIDIMQGMHFMLGWRPYAKLMALLEEQSLLVARIVARLLLLQLLWVAAPVKLGPHLLRRQTRPAAGRAGG